MSVLPIAAVSSAIILTVLAVKTSVHLIFNAMQASRSREKFEQQQRNARASRPEGWK